MTPSPATMAPLPARQDYQDEAELCVLGAMMVNPGVVPIVREIVSGEDFYATKNALIFKAILAVSETAEPDQVTVAGELERRNQIEQAGGRDYLHVLVEFVPAAANAAHYAEMVREASIRRRMARATTKLSVAIDAHDITSQDAAFAEIEELRGVRTSTSGADSAKDVWLAPLSAAEWASRTPERPDYVLEPWAVRGYITDIVGREKGGKSTFVASACAAIAEGQEFLGYSCEQAPVLYLYESTEGAWRHLTVDAGLTECRHVKAHLWPHLMPAIRSLSWPEMCEWIAELILKIGAALVVLDILPTWAKLASDAENDPGVARVTMDTLRLMAAETHCAVWTLRHTRKGQDLDHVEGSRGTGAWIGAVDISMGYRASADTSERRAHPNRRVLSSIGRAPLPGDLSLEYDRERHLFTHVDSLDATERRDIRGWLFENLPTSIEDAIAGGWSKSVITHERAKQAGYAQHRSLACLNSLVSEGLVMARQAPGGSGRPATYYFVGGDNGLF